MLIYLETGTGKTVISIMLINYYLKKYNFTKKVLEFIVGAVLGDYNLVGGVTVKRNPFENASNSEKF